MTPENEMATLNGVGHPIISQVGRQSGLARQQVECLVAQRPFGPALYSARMASLAHDRALNIGEDP